MILRKIKRLGLTSVIVKCQISILEILWLFGHKHNNEIIYIFNGESEILQHALALVSYEPDTISSFSVKAHKPLCLVFLLALCQVPQYFYETTRLIFLSSWLIVTYM